MIHTLTGKLVSKYSNAILVETGGVGFKVFVPESVLKATPPLGEEIDLFIFLYLPGLSKLQELRTEEERLGRELADLEKKIQVLREEKNLLPHDVAYAENVIREELGLVKPGEMVYKILPEKKPLPAEKSPLSSTPETH